jgi:hypothetical protein
MAGANSKTESELWFKEYLTSQAYNWAAAHVLGWRKDAQLQRTDALEEDDKLNHCLGAIPTPQFDLRRK